MTLNLQADRTAPYRLRLHRTSACAADAAERDNATVSDHLSKQPPATAHPSRVLHPGDQVRHYRIVSVIGYGKFGAVYEAEAIGGQPNAVALKETLHSNSIRIFRREFEVLSQIQHPNLPRYYGSFIEEGRGYLVMDLVPGQNLLEVLKKRTQLADGRREPLPEPLVIGCYAMQLCEALRHLHGQAFPIIHRDLKPANIRVTPDGLVKLVDFGLLKLVGDETHPDIRGIGTAPYAPLEQYSSSGTVTDQRSDIYSLSAMLYHLLTGQVPVPVIQRVGRVPDPLLPPRHYVPELSPHISDAIMVGMNLSKQDRYPDVTMFKRALLDDSAVNMPRALRGHAGRVHSVAYSRDAQIIASASGDGTVRVWNAPEGRLLHTLRGHTGKVYSVACSPDGQMIASAGADQTVRLWQASDGALVRVFPGHGGSVRSVTWSPDGRLIASAGDDAVVHIWRATDNGQSYTLRGHSDRINALAWSPDGRMIASAGADQTVRLWRLATGTVLATMQEHHDEITAVVWSANGRLIASAGADQTVRLWQVQDGSLLRSLRGHTNCVNGIAFSPDGQTLASASADQTVRLWQVQDGALLHVLQGHAGALNTVAYNPDGQTFIIGGDDKTLREWMAVGVRGREFSL
jgi:serine/threonine protein kinase/sugar lactone lactonase YvrE